MNRHLKKAAEALLPERIFVTIQSIRSRNYQGKLNRESGIYRSTVEVVENHGNIVLDGPFRGMRYPKDSLLSHNGVSILFGTYELELHQIVEEVASRSYDKIIDVGCAEGYYAVGFALRNNAPIYAFDCEPRERRHCRKMALINHVSDLVHVKSWCSRRTLKSLAAGRCLIVCDCEGYEVHLFSEDVVKVLQSCDLIIELHEVPGVDTRATLLDRFKNTHDARLISFDRERKGYSARSMEKDCEGS